MKKYLNLIMSGVFLSLDSPKIGINKSILISIIPQVIKGLLKETPNTQVIINIKINKVFTNQAILKLINNY